MNFAQFYKLLNLNANRKAVRRTFSCDQNSCARGEGELEPTTFAFWPVMPRLTPQARFDHAEHQQLGEVLSPTSP